MTETPEEPSPKSGGFQITPFMRLGLLALGLVALFAIGRLTGLTDKLDLETIRGWLEAAGPWGVLLMIGLTVGVNFLQIPAVPFILASQLTWGVVMGSVYGYLASVACVIVVFVVVRKLGGSPGKREIKRAWMRKLLGHLEDRPILVCFVLRSLTVANPTLTYALALSSIRFRDYVIGSALGLVIPVVFYAVLIGAFGWAPGSGG